MSEEPRHIEFYILRYVPGVVEGASINIGVLVLERRREQVCFATARFLNDMDRIVAFDPDADTDLLWSFFRDIERQLQSLEEVEPLLRMTQESFSNALQISEGTAVTISGDPAIEVDKLARHYLA